MAREEGVTPVLANVFMVAVLVGVSIAVYALLAQFEDAAQSPDRRQGSFTVDLGPGDHAFHITYVKGEAIPLQDGTLKVTVDGTTHEHPLTDLAPQTADGSRWVVGESVCVVGPGTCLHASAATVDVVLVVEEDVMFHAERNLQA